MADSNILIQSSKCVQLAALQRFVQHKTHACGPW